MGLIRRAYVSDPFTPIMGGPSWIHSAFYDIEAQAEGSPSIATMRGPMMQVLLEDRFKLKIHHETMEGPVFFLTIAPGGPKLHSFKEGSCTPYPAGGQAPPLPTGQKYCMQMIGLLPNGNSHVEAQGATLDEFSKMLRPHLGRPVINQAGLSGKFDIYVEFSGEGTAFSATAAGPPPRLDSATSDPTGVPSIFAATQEQLGLKLESGRGPVDRFVIDHIERPSEK